MRQGRMTVPEGPGWTDVFVADDVAGGGDGDGKPARGMLLSVPLGEVGEVEYRWAEPGAAFDDPAPNDHARLGPGEAAPLIAAASSVGHIQCRGVDSDVIVQIEETHR